MIHATDDDDLPDLWTDEIPITTTPSYTPIQQHSPNHDTNVKESRDTPTVGKDKETRGPVSAKTEQNPQTNETNMSKSGYNSVPDHAPREFNTGP